MKSIVIYLSMSGNTKKIAQAIHKGMSQVSEQCDIARLRDVTAKDLANYDLIGLGSPVIRFTEFPPVTQFIENTMLTAEGKHGFAFCTHGTVPGHYLSRVVPAMIQRGLVMVGWNNWFCSCYYPSLPKPYLTDGHPDEIDLKEAEEFGREMVERSRRIYGGETGLIPEFPRGRAYDEIYHPPEVWKDPGRTRYATTVIPRSESALFTINMKKCNYPKCTFCIDNCPMGAIDFEVSPPLFNRNCQKCYQCEMTCPTGAIEYDFAPLQAVHTLKRGESILEKALEIFEARGKFRRLIPVDKVGWDTPAWTFKKPRYKIE